MQEDRAPAEGGALADHQSHAGQAECDDRAGPATAPPEVTACWSLGVTAIRRCGQQERPEHEPTGEEHGRGSYEVRGGRDAGVRQGGHREGGDDRADAPGGVAAVEDGTSIEPLDGDGVCVHCGVRGAVNGAERRCDQGELDRAAGQADEGQQQRHDDKRGAQDGPASDPGHQRPDELHRGKGRQGEEHPDDPELTVGEVVLTLQGG